MKIGDAAANFLPEYLYMGSSAEVVYFEENKEELCMCVQLSNGTWWFLGEDCVMRVPRRIEVSRVILMEDGYAWDDGSLIPELTYPEFTKRY